MYVYIAASVKLPPEKFISSKDRDMGPQETPSEPKTLILNSSDELYSELRDKNFSAVGQAVSRKAKVITAQFDVSFIMLLYNFTMIRQAAAITEVFVDSLLLQLNR